jgi:microcystin-dependent protein
MADAHKNFATSSVQVAPAPAATGLSLTVGAGDGAIFPVAPFNATVCAQGQIPTVNTAEIVRVTAKAVDVFTIVRQQEGTAARNIQVSDVISANITAKSLTDIEFPPGAIIMYGAAAAPTGWLLCDGAAVSRATYADLFANIGTTWGVGDGATTFNVPDMRGKAPIGQGTGAGLTARVIGNAAIGEENHLLSQAEMPSHTHIQNAHNHNYDKTGWTINGTAGASEAGNFSTTATATTNATATNQNTGGGGTHNNMQPSAVVNFIIRT